MKPSSAKAKKLSKTEKENIKLALANEAKKELAKRYLIYFTKYTMKDYEVNWHHEFYAKKLDEFRRGQIKKLMVFMPPQHGKSELCSRRLPAMMIGENPDLRVVLASYNTKLGEKFLREIKRIVTEDTYKRIYGDFQIGEVDRYINQAGEFEIPFKKGSIYGTGVGGGLTSRPVDVMIIDDPYKDAQDAWSIVSRKSVQDWFDTVVRTRLHNESQQLITLTRWHPDDLAGRLLKTEDDWEVVIFPAIKEETYNPDDPREVGQPLWPEKHSLKKLEEIRDNNPHIFKSLYQQDPRPAEGLLFPKEELKYFGDYVSRVGDESAAKFAVCDIADEGSDFLAFGVFYCYDKKDLYLMDVVFSQATAEKTEPQVAVMIDKYQVPESKFESNNGGKFYARNVEKMIKSNGKVIWKATTKNKETRILLQSGVVKSHMYFRNDPYISREYRAFIEQLTGYMKEAKNEHDDAADMVTMAIEKISNNRQATLHSVSWM